MLAELQKKNNESKVFFAMFEKLYIDVAVKYKLSGVDVQAEQKKLEQVSPNGELDSIVRKSEFVSFETVLEDKNEQIEESSSDSDDNLAGIVDTNDDMGTEVH